MNTRRCAGFTLAELLAVVAILAVIAGIVIPNLAFNDDNQLTVAAGETGNALRLARSEAVRSGRSVLVDTTHGRRATSGWSMPPAPAPARSRR